MFAFVYIFERGFKLKGERAGGGGVAEGDGVIAVTVDPVAQ